MKALTEAQLFAAYGLDIDEVELGTAALPTVLDEAPIEHPFGYTGRARSRSVIADKMPAACGGSRPTSVGRLAFQEV